MASIMIKTTENKLFTLQKPLVQLLQNEVH
jgi:hypothetical protein